VTVALACHFPPAPLFPDERSKYNCQLQLQLTRQNFACDLPSRQQQKTLAETANSAGNSVVLYLSLCEYGIICYCYHLMPASRKINKWKQQLIPTDTMIGMFFSISIQIENIFISSYIFNLF